MENPLPEMKWQTPAEGMYYDDLTKLLAAVEVTNRLLNVTYWEFTIVVVHCGEGYFDLQNEEGDMWKSSLEEVSQFCVLSGRVRGSLDG